MKAKSQKKNFPVAEATLSKPKKRDRSGSEARLLKAGEETFAKYGFAGTTTKLIAQKAKLNEALIARYFGGKMGLMLAIIEDHISEKHKALAYEPKGSLEEELTSYILDKLDMHCSHDESFFRIVISQAMVDQKFAKNIRAAAPPSPDKNLVERLEKLMKAGKMRPGLNLQSFVQALEIQLHGTFVFEQILMGRSREEIKVLVLYARDVFTSFGQK